MPKLVASDAASITLLLEKRALKDRSVYENYVAEVGKKKRENRVIVMIPSRIYITKTLAKLGTPATVLFLFSLSCL